LGMVTWPLYVIFALSIKSPPRDKYPYILRISLLHGECNPITRIPGKWQYGILVLRFINTDTYSSLDYARGCALIPLLTQPFDKLRAVSLSNRTKS
jgi:hypothetical protein